MPSCEFDGRASAQAAAKNLGKTMCTVVLVMAVVDVPESNDFGGSCSSDL